MVKECSEIDEKKAERQWILNVLAGHKEDYAFIVKRTAS